MENYFNYFTEIEEHFQRRRGTGLLLSTLDWALIETWKDAGIPLEAVRRGVDAAFDRYDQRKSRTRKINGLAYCSQEVLAAAEEMKEAAVGMVREDAAEASEPPFDAKQIAAHLKARAVTLEQARLPEGNGVWAGVVAKETSRTLRDLAAEVESKGLPVRLEDLERHLTVLEQKILAVLMAAAPDEEIIAVRAQADRDIAPYRSKMPAAQIDQLQKQYVHKRLLEKYDLPRLSLFYL